MQEENTSPNNNSSPMSDPPVKPLKSSFESKPQKSPFDNYVKGSSNNYFVNTGFGESKYDTDFNWDAQFNELDPQGSITENRAQQQGWGTKAAAGIARTGVKVGIEVAKMPGFIMGAVAAPFAEEGQGWETAVNNSWIKSLNGLNEDINADILPVYVKKAVSEGDLWDNISSVDFWATDGADGVGYILSMMAPGAGFKALGMGNKIMGATSKGLAFARYGGNTEKSIAALTKLGLKAESFDVAGTAIVNTLFEASAEAGGAMESFENGKEDFINKLVISENKTFEEAESEFNQQKALLGRNIFISNVGILAGPNLIMSKMLWGKAGAKSLTAVEDPSLLRKIGNRAQNVLSATASEGFIEEAGQSTVETMYTDKAKRGTLTNSMWNDTSASDVVDNYLDTISSTEGQKAMFLGAFLGGGMTAYSGAKQDIANRKQTNSLIALTEENINNFNKVVETDIYKRDTEGNIVYNYNNVPQLDPVKVVEQARALAFTEEQSKIFDIAAQQGNLEVVDTLKQRAVDQLITPFITQGEMGIQALKQYLEETSKAEEIQVSDKNNNNKSFINDILEKAKYMKSQYEAYDGFSRELINLKNENAQPEDITDYYNSLASIYINLKGQEYTEKKNLNKLNSEKSNLLSEVNFTPQINTGEIVDENSTEDMYKYRYDTDPRLKLLNDKIQQSENRLKEINKTVNEDIWNSEKVNEAFAEKLKDVNSIREEASKELELEAQVTQIQNTESLEELAKIETENPEIAKVIEEKQSELEFVEESKDSVVNNINEDIVEEKNLKSSQYYQDDISQPINLSIEPVQTIIPSKDESIDGDITTAEESPVSNNENLTESINKQLSKSQGGAKVISTVQATGEKFDFVSQDFLDYERNGKDKSKDKVGFEINTTYEGDNENIKQALSVYKPGKFDYTPKEITLLENWLPVNSIFNNNVNAPLETLTTSVNANKIFKIESLPLRKNIINALVNGSKIEDISSNIIKQFPGQLKVEDQVIDNSVLITPENNIRDLEIFQGLNDTEFIKEFVKRTYYVNYSGQLVNVINKDKIKSTTHDGKGEIFLEIPQNNGKPFMLKLNFKRIDFFKAEGTYEIIKALSQVSPTVENPNIQTVSITDFLDNLPENSQQFIRDSLSGEIELINQTYKNEIERTIEKLLDLIVYQKSSNSKTKLRLDPQGNLELGSLSPIAKIRRVDLESNESKNIIIDFLNKKKHNILITKDDKLQFNNLNYLNYIFNNKLLSTNAVVNQPTFQGYSNIYLNTEIKTKVQPKQETVKEIVTPLNEDGSDPKTVAVIQAMLNRGKSKKVEEVQKVETKEDIKIETEFDFNSLDKKNQQKLLYALKMELDVTLNDSQMLQLRTNPKLVYDELISIAKTKNKNIDNIIKRCG